MADIVIGQRTQRLDVSIAEYKPHKIRLKKGGAKPSYVIDGLLGIISDSGQTAQSIRAQRLEEYESVD